MKSQKRGFRREKKKLRDKKLMRDTKSSYAR